MKKIQVNKITTNRILSPTSINLADYVINPYRGCEFGCTYCYSKNNKNMTGRREKWGEFVDVKINSPDLFKKELNKIKDKHIRVLLGSITEVFQPVEQEFQIVREILHILKDENIPCVILTKSILIKEYLDLLTYSADNIIYITYNTAIIKKLFEKATPDYNLRLEVMNMILAKKIKLTVYISPYLPFLSDFKVIMDDLTKLSDRNFHLYFENYNLKMGNWSEIKNKIPEDILKKYFNIFSHSAHYYDYWDKIQKDILEYNKKFNYTIKFFIYPYDDYYRNEF